MGVLVAYCFSCLKRSETRWGLWHLFQLHDVTLGITDVDRLSHAAGAVAICRVAHHVDAAVAKIRGDGGHVARLNTEAYVVDVGARFRARCRGRNQIDHAAPCAKLN